MRERGRNTHRSNHDFNYCKHIYIYILISEQRGEKETLTRGCRSLPCASRARRRGIAAGSAAANLICALCLLLIWTVHAKEEGVCCRVLPVCCCPAGGRWLLAGSAGLRTGGGRPGCCWCRSAVALVDGLGCWSAGCSQIKEGMALVAPGSGLCWWIKGRLEEILLDHRGECHGQVLRRRSGHGLLVVVRPMERGYMVID